MTQEIDSLYEEAIASGLLPGVSLLAGDKNGNILYSKSFGKASLKEGDNRPFTESTIASIASMSKLMTVVAVLQCVEDGILDLDKDVASLCPGIGKYGLIVGFDDTKNSAIFTPNPTPITLRMLLTHTSGHEYEWNNALLLKWRASRNEQPSSGLTLEEQAALPLVFEPGKGFAYGHGLDWAGKAVESATNLSLDDFMRKRIWTPLGIENDASFYPRAKDSMKDRIADVSTLDKNGKPPAVHFPGFDISGGSTDCFGGAGVYSSTKAYYTFLSSVMRRDPKLLKPSSYEELFRPQLDDRCEQALNDDIISSPIKTQYLGLQIPASIRKTWNLAGLVAKEAQEGRFAQGTTLWGGYPCCEWFIDHESGICGVAICQLVPPMQPDVMALHEKFQRAMFGRVRANL
ncbi:beta-lactamase/transpeptidase-like protein [Annulohypoxylon truncatum]|uniref:beta-lactamase/transpeptidase-like protein n=1 Tax=Annulohypoxylon truncatum TaxID=327061 RepID=UPI002008B258|nr:beta-lactamase/transpeptidase-like protein [Annulohypoxylon truncatum]KAI1204283.1 beta-lactamase/transpeptidase-like protein [Annulohypoxylon truncatum]